MTVVVNLFAGPGAGKSTTRAGVFYKLKMAGYNVEEAPEYAKDLTWDERYNTLACQPYVFGKQLYRLHRLNGKVDAIITDSPLLLGLFYGKNEPASLSQLVLDKFNSFNNLNFFVHRAKKYNPSGRNQTEDQAKDIDMEIFNLLSQNHVNFGSVLGNEAAIELIVPSVIERIHIAHSTT